MKQMVLEILAIFLLTVCRYFIVAGTAFMIVYKWLAARMASSKIQLRSVTSSAIWHEIRHSIASILMLAITAYVVIRGPLHDHTLIYDDVHTYPLWWLPVSLVLTLVIHDTYFYWIHRLMHHERIFQFVHLVHHRSVNPSPWASYSFHVMEAVLEGAVVIVLAFVMPLHPGTIMAFTLVSFVINVYGHLGYEIMPRWFRHSIMFEFVNTSCHHNLHHKRFKGNYGLYFRVWDRLMGTEHPDYVKEYDRVQAQRFGVKGGVIITGIDRH